MRFIHTADWHLGRIFYGVYLTEDQVYVLDQLVEIVKDQKPDALLISGDIYDRAVPSPEAVELLDNVLTRIVLKHKVPVIIIAGNHDSPQRLGFASSLLKKQGLHVTSLVSSEINPVVIDDRNGPVFIYPLPYAEPAVARGALGNEDINSHAAVMEEMLGRIKAIHPHKQRSIIMAHAFVVGGEGSESERPLSIGGAGTVESTVFSGFNYVALGHLHKPQSTGSEHINYAGSLLKYSFSESDHTKSVNVVEMDGKGRCRIEKIPLSLRRDVRRVEGTFKEILKGPEKGRNKEDYLLGTLHDKGAILDAMIQLREVYPNVLHIERPFIDTSEKLTGFKGDLQKIDDAELFASFFSQVTDDKPTEDQISSFASVVDKLQRRDREA
ncbi:exonuclease SbcCD subunit D [Acidobacteriota bacterium]